MKEKLKDHISWDQFFLGIALLSTKKQGGHEKNSDMTVSCIVINFPA